MVRRVTCAALPAIFLAACSSSTSIAPTGGGAGSTTSGTGTSTSSDGTTTGTTTGSTSMTTSTKGDGCDHCGPDKMCQTCSGDSDESPTTYHCLEQEPEPNPGSPPHFECGNKWCETATEYCNVYTYPYCGCSPANVTCNALPEGCTSCDCIGELPNCDTGYPVYCSQDADSAITVHCDSLYACG